MSATVEDTLARRVVESLAVVDGQLVLPEPALKALGREIHESEDPQPLAAGLIALALRLKELPGSYAATTQVCALAAIALGDVPLNGALCRALYVR